MYDSIHWFHNFHAIINECNWYVSVDRPWSDTVCLWRRRSAVYSRLMSCLAHQRSQAQWVWWPGQVSLALWTPASCRTFTTTNWQLILTPVSSTCNSSVDSTSSHLSGTGKVFSWPLIDSSGACKMQDMKIQDVKVTDQLARCENTRRETARGENTRRENARHHQVAQIT